MKKSWNAPQLSVLRRTSTTESVLLFCKGVGSSQTTPGSVDQACRDSGGMNCNDCYSLSLS